MDILLTGGASGLTKSPQQLDISGLQCKLFGCKNRDERVSGTNIPKYSEKVLTGNWYEDRAIDLRTTDEWITVNNINYKPHVLKDLKDDLYTIWKTREKLQGTGSKLCADDDAYLDNMTSSYDLSFRILPKGLCGPRKRVYNARNNAWMPETELALSYGNQTKYGLVDAIKSEEDDLKKLFLPMQSMYQVDYIERIAPKDLNEKRFPKPRVDMNAPDLRHLGINLPSTSRPSAREPQYRSSRCENICTWL